MLAAKVERAGVISLPAKLLSDVVSGLPNQAITLDMDARTQSVFLSCGRFECNIKGIEAGEFPIIPSFAGRTASATFAPEALCCAVGQVAFAAASDETHPILTGVRIALKDQLASFAAADSFRLTFRDILLDKPVREGQEVVVPARAMQTLGKVMADVEGDVEMLLDAGERVLFRAEGVELVSRAGADHSPHDARAAAYDQVAQQFHPGPMARPIHASGTLASVKFRLDLLPRDQPQLFRGSCYFPSSQVSTQDSLILGLFEHGDQSLPGRDTNQRCSRLPIGANHKLHVFERFAGGHVVLLATTRETRISHALYHALASNGI